ncbi:MAG: glutathione S-transferase family protein, partial [Solirubrobacteraceae bacterium]
QWSVFAMSELEPSVFAWLRARRAGEEESEHAARFAPVGATFRDLLGDGRPWLIGETFTVADILCSSILGTSFRRELIDETGPLRSYVERAQQRPANLRAEAIRS